MSKPRSQRVGRKNNSDRIRELVALLGSLSSTGDVVTIGAISSRLGISTQEAQGLMDIVCQASGEEWGGLLISSNDDETEYTLQYPGTRGRPIRLTESETIALVHALDVAGVGESDPLREKLGKAFSSPSVDEDVVRQALGRVAQDAGTDSLHMCAQAQVEQRSVSFWYKGVKDDEPRKRRCSVRSLLRQEDSWYVRAFDLDIQEDRTFRVDRMTNTCLGDRVTLSNVPRITSNRLVEITFYDLRYYQIFDWPGLRVLRTTNKILVGSIPYYGDTSDWLLRRICAGKGRIMVNDKRIMHAAQTYAERLLSSLG